MARTIFCVIVLGIVVHYCIENYLFVEIPDGIQADYVLVKKSERKLVLFNKGVEIKWYDISLGKNISGKKDREGDGKTPEGSYVIDYHKKNSAYNLALHISYPNADDIKAAETNGVAPGGAIMIHGLRNGLGIIGNLHRLFDWTAGCIAMTNREIEEVWRVVPDGTIITITP